MMSYILTANPPKTFKKFPANTCIMLTGTNEEDIAPWRDIAVPRGLTGYNFYNSRSVLADVLSYRDLRDRAVTYAGRLAAAGVKPGERIGLLAATAVGEGIRWGSLRIALRTRGRDALDLRRIVMSAAVVALAVFE